MSSSTNAGRRENFAPVAMGVSTQLKPIALKNGTIAGPLPGTQSPTGPVSRHRPVSGVRPRRAQSRVTGRRIINGRTINGRIAGRHIAGRVPPACNPSPSRAAGAGIRMADPFRFTIRLPILFTMALSLAVLAAGVFDDAILSTGPVDIAFANEGIRPDVSVKKASLEGPGFGKTWDELVFTRHRTTRNETISRIAFDYGLSPSTLISVNELDSDKLGEIGRGTMLIVPYRDGFRVSPEEGEGPAEVAARYGTVSDRVRLIPGTGDFFVAGAAPDSPAADTGALFHYPVAGRVISPFGTGVDRLTGIPYESEGIDLSAAKGTEVRSSRDGTVIFTGHHASYGLYVMMSHSGGWKSFYGHLSRIDVAPGDKVKESFVIGAVGDSGTARSPRLHFVLFRGGEPVDPLDYLY